MISIKCKSCKFNLWVLDGIHENSEDDEVILECRMCGVKRNIPKSNFPVIQLTEYIPLNR